LARRGLEGIGEGEKKKKNRVRPFFHLLLPYQKGGRSKGPSEEGKGKKTEQKGRLIPLFLANFLYEKRYRCGRKKKKKKGVKTSSLSIFKLISCGGGQGRKGGARGKKAYNMGRREKREENHDERTLLIPFITWKEVRKEGT